MFKYNKSDPRIVAARRLCHEHRFMSDEEFESSCASHRYEVLYGIDRSNPYNHTHHCDCHAALCAYNDDDDISVHSSISQRESRPQVTDNAIVPYRPFNAADSLNQAVGGSVTTMELNRGSITVVDGSTMSIGINYGAVNVVGNGMVNIDVNYGTVVAVSIHRVNITVNHGDFQIHQ